MSLERISLGNLPVELLFRILSFFGPEDARTLRYVILACHNTDHENLYTVAEKVLQDQRAWLLDRWRKIHTKTSVPLGALPGIESIAEQVIGKQYVRATEIINNADRWVSFYTMLPVRL